MQPSLLLISSGASFDFQNHGGPRNLQIDFKAWAQGSEPFCRSVWVNFPSMLILLNLLIPAQAQVVTGGGTADSDPGEGGMEALDPSVSAYTQHLKFRLKKCAPTEKWNPDADLFELFLVLKTKKQSIPKQSKPALKKFFACLNDSQSKHLWTGLKNQSEFIPFLVRTFKISPDEAVKIEKFFEDLETLDN